MFVILIGLLHLPVLLFYLLEDGKEFFYCLGAEHGDAQLLEVGQSLEEGGGGQVTAYVEYATMFVEAGYALVHLVAQDIHALVEGESG